MKDELSIETKKIELFKPYSNVFGGFTLKNTGIVNRNGKIPGLNCGLSTAAPAEESEKNRQILFQELKLDGNRISLARQIHSNHVEIVNSGGIYEDTDAMITNTTGVTLAIQVADCAAILLADPENNIIAAVHAGWRSAIADILPITIEKLNRLGANRPDRLLAYVSPCISQHYFEVGKEVALKFPDHFVDYRSFRKPHVNLKGFLVQQLMTAGLDLKQIQIDPECTYRSTSRYYSYRREGEKAGRMLAYIGLIPKHAV